MEPAPYNLTFNRGTYGSKAAVVLSFFDANGNVIPVAGIGCVISATQGAYRLFKSLAAGTLTADTTANTITWTPTQAEVAAVPKSGVPWLVELTWPDGSGQRVIEGVLTGAGI